MTRILCTYTEPVHSNSVVPVAWEIKNGPILRGRLNVSFSEGRYTRYKHRELRVLAELTAIRHLVFEQLVYGSHILPESSIELEITHGLIKKIALGKVDNPFSFSDVVFLFNRLLGCQFTVRKSGNVPESIRINDIEAEPIQPGERTNEPLLSQSLGQFIVSHHAIERYIEYNRQNNVDIDRPARKLSKRIMYSTANPVKLDNKQLKHKTRKYGLNDNAEIYQLGNSSHHITAIPFNGREDLKSVITYFKREEYE